MAFGADSSLGLLFITVTLLTQVESATVPAVSTVVSAGDDTTHTSETSSTVSASGASTASAVSASGASTASTVSASGASTASTVSTSDASTASATALTQANTGHTSSADNTSTKTQRAASTTAAAATLPSQKTTQKNAPEPTQDYETFGITIGIIVGMGIIAISILLVVISAIYYKVRYGDYDMKKKKNDDKSPDGVTLSFDNPAMVPDIEVSPTENEPKANNDVKKSK